jgi:glycerophosphoryl diester phosphodiesterase
MLDQGRHPGRVLVIAHRGASTEAPENTLSSIERAVVIGADAVEFDVRSTFDDKLVLMHDEKVDRTTNGRGAVSSMTLDNIRRLDAGYWFSSQFRGERVPRLGDAIDVLARSNSVPLVELKDKYDAARSAAPTLIGMLRDFGISDRTVVIARDPKQLACVKALSPWTATAIVTFSRGEAERATGGSIDGLVAYWPSLSQRLVRMAHGSGEFVAAWTVEPRRMSEVARYGVDALITDDPRSGLMLARGMP